MVAIPPRPIGSCIWYRSARTLSVCMTPLQRDIVRPISSYGRNSLHPYICAFYFNASCNEMEHLVSFGSKFVLPFPAPVHHLHAWLSVAHPYVRAEERYICELPPEYPVPLPL